MQIQSHTLVRPTDLHLSSAGTVLQVLEARAGDNWIVSDLVADPFYRLLHLTYPLQAPLQVILTAVVPLPLCAH